MAKKKKKRIICLVIVAVLAAAAAGGIYAYINRYNAADYVKAVLDVSYKGERKHIGRLPEFPRRKRKKYLRTTWTLQWRDLRLRPCRRN